MKKILKFAITAITLMAIAQSFATANVFSIKIFKESGNQGEGVRDIISGKEPGV